MRSTVKTFKEFYHLGIHIMLTESKDKKDVMRVIVNCPTTADMTFITPGGAATLYPTMTFKYFNYLTETGRKLVNHEKLGSVSS
jgi:hypothetical protein